MQLRTNKNASTQLVRCLLDAETAKGFFARHRLGRETSWSFARANRPDGNRADYLVFIGSVPGKPRLFRLYLEGGGVYSLAVANPVTNSLEPYGDQWQASTLTHAEFKAKQMADEYYRFKGPSFKASRAVREDESPKEFLKRKGDLLKKPGYVEEYALDDHGIDNSQYFTGGSTAYTQWDAAFVGVGDNPNEAADDAIDSAAQSGWLVDKIVNDFPDLPSAHAYSMEGVRDETKREILRRKPELADDEQQLELEIDAELEDYDNDSDLNYYVILWVRGKQPVYPDYGAPEPPPPVAEAETAKEFIKRITDLAPPASFGKKKFRWKREYDPRTGSLSNYERRRVPGIRSTQFRRYAPGEYSVRYHNTDVLRFNRQGSAVTDTGGYSSKTTFDRMNSHLPHGWRIYRYQGTRYWTNQRWPEEIRDEVFSIRTRRRPPRESAYMIPYGRGDWIDKRGNLYTQNGHLVITPAGTTTGPEPPQEVQEGRYQQRLDWINRVRKKHEKMKEIGKLERELEKVEEPDRRKKRMNLH